MNIQTEENLVDVVTVRERPDRDPAEPIIGHVHIWQQGGLIDVHVTGPQETE